MLNKMKFFVATVFAVACCAPVFAETVIDEEEEISITTEEDGAAAMEKLSADAVAAYDVNGSLFQQITDLEQEKVLMQLEKERAQLDLELDRLAAEKIKLHMEIDTLSGRAEAQQQEIETEKAKLEAEAARLEREKESLEAAAKEPARTYSASASSEQEQTDVDLAKKYKLVNVIGAGSQLMATITDLDSGQNKRVSVGRMLDGYAVKSISLDDGVVLVKDGVTQTLNIGAGR